MGIFDSLFGGGGSSTEQASLLTGGQKTGLGNLGSFVNPQIGQGAEVFGGQRVAGPGQLQQGAFDIFDGLQGQIGGALGGGLEGLGLSREALQGFLGQFDPAQSQQNFQTGVVDPALRNFQQVIQPGISERLSNVAGSSGVLSQAFANAGADLQSNLSAQGAAFNQNARNRFDQNKLNATGQLTGQSQLGLNFLNTLTNLGGQQRDITQQGLGADFSRFQEGQAVNNPILGLLPTLLGTRAFENVVTPGGGGGLGQTLGTLGGSFLGTEAGSAAASAGTQAIFTALGFSDRRLKDNLQEIAKIKGIQFYTWDWNNLAREIGLEGSATGVVAQELENIIPEAVKMDDTTGYFQVDYNKLFERIG